MHLFLIPTWVTAIFFVAVSCASLWKGGWRERTVAIVLTGEIIFSTFICGPWSCKLGFLNAWAPDPWLWRPTLDDVVVLAVCFACVIKAERYWTVAACSVALLGVAADLAALAPGVTRWAYSSATLVFSYLVAFTVLWGVCSQPRAGVPAGRELRGAGALTAFARTRSQMIGRWIGRGLDWAAPTFAPVSRLAWRGRQSPIGSF
ncbi:MAG TPA: hypothetical protein VGI95_09935 [Caulobacteraceae bacterium]|jgi:hypothetical protein